MKKTTLILVLSLFTAACGSVNLADLGGILGSTGQDDRSDVRGTISRVDFNQQRIELDVSYVNNLRQEESGSAIYFDDNTRVEHEGNSYRVEDLERGDEVSIQGSNRNGRFVADTITVTRDASR